MTSRPSWYLGGRRLIAVDVAPSWPGDWFVLDEPNGSYYRLNPLELGSEAEPLSDDPTATICPVFSLTPALDTPSGWVEPWIVRVGATIYLSLNLPDDLVGCPHFSESPPSAVGSRSKLEQRLHRLIARPSRRLAAPLRCPELLEEIRSLRDVKIVVFFASRTGPWEVMRLASGADLIDAVTSRQDVGHLIHGVLDDDGCEPWI